MYAKAHNKDGRNRPPHNHVLIKGNYIMSTNVKNTVRAVSVDGNAAMTAVLNGLHNAGSKLLPLAIDVHQNKGNLINVGNVLSGAPAKNKKRATAVRECAASNYESFANVLKAQANAKVLAKQKSKRAFEASEQIKSAERQLTAATILFERALLIAYFFKAHSLVITHATSSIVTVKFGAPTKIKDVDYNAGHIEQYTATDLMHLGKDEAKAHGIYATTPRNGKVGESVSTGAQKAILETASLFGDTVSKLALKDRIEVTTSAQFEAMLAHNIRARFTDDTNMIDIAQVIDVLRKSDVMKGVRIETHGANGKANAKK